MNEKQFWMFLFLYSRRDSVKQFDHEEGAEMDRKSRVHPDSLGPRFPVNGAFLSAAKAMAT